MPFEPLEHTADIGLRAFGKSLREAFENAARGMFGLMVDTSKIEKRKKFSVSAEADDAEGLLVAWLNELLYHSDTNDMLFKDFEIWKWDEKSKLDAFAYGEPVDLARHQFEMDIKACTYHQLKITKNNLFVCQVIFDV